jgi:hypothetical protein
MKYRDLRDFIAQLEKLGELKRIGVEVDPHLEMTEVCDRVLRAAGRRCSSRSRRAMPSRCSPTCSARRTAWRWAWARNPRGAARSGRAAGLR